MTRESRTSIIHFPANKTKSNSQFMKFGMRSRLKRGPTRLLEFFYELRRPSPGTKPVSEYRFCLQGASNVLEEWEKRIVEYALPNWYEYDHLSDSFCSVFTDINSVFTFLFVKFYRDEDSPNGLRCLALVSHHPLFEVFPELLQCLSYYLVHAATRNLTLIEEALAKLAACELVRPLANLTELTGVVFEHTQLRRTAPPDDQLPGLTQCSPLMELFNKISSPDTLLFLLSAMLLEKKLLLVGKRLRQLSLSVIGCVSLLYPMSWEHVLVPSLSASNIDHIGCLVPYIFGLAQPLYLANEKQVDSNFSDPDFVRVDLETGDIFMAEPLASDNGRGGEPTLPSALVKLAKKSLKRLQLPAGSKQQAPVNDGHFSQTFLRVNAELLAPFRAMAIKGELFNAENYLRLSPEGYHTFLRRLFESQLFLEFGDRYLSNPDDVQYLLFNQAAEEALLRRRNIPNYRAIKKSLLTATEEGAKRAAAGSAIAKRTLARNVAEGSHPKLAQHSKKPNKPPMRPPALFKTSVYSSADVLDGGGTGVSVDNPDSNSPPVELRPRPATMTMGLRQATLLELPSLLRSAVNPNQLMYTIGVASADKPQRPARPPPPRPPPPSTLIASATNAADTDDNADDSDNSDDVSSESSHELRISLHLVSISSPVSVAQPTNDYTHAASEDIDRTLKPQHQLMIKTNGPLPLPPLSSLPDELPGSPLLTPNLTDNDCLAQG